MQDAHPTATIRLHPRITETCHDHIQALIAGLIESEAEGKARQAIRGIIDKIVMTPVPDPGKWMRPQVELHGTLAAILGLSLGTDQLSGQQNLSVTG